MKVFTVGMDQKPSGVEKVPDAPPPGYSSSQPIPMGPEIAPIIVRKSRGYKGILLVMLGVFLMAVFALTLSEIVYNRQRDENFFRLQWAQLKHRVGYPEYEFVHRGDRIIPVGRDRELPPEALAIKQEQPSTTTTEQPAVPKFILDNQPQMMLQGSSSSSSASSSEQQEMPEQLIRDARFQFLRNILQKIKQNAEAMGFDGTMQVSVIEVEPQQMEMVQQQQQAQQQALQQAQQGHPARGNFGPSEDPHSDAFLDSFGEFHAPPPFAHNNEIGDAAPQMPPMIQPARGRIFGPWMQPQEGQQGHGGPEFATFEIPPPFMNPFFRPIVEQQQQMQFRPQPPQDWTMQRPEEVSEQQQPQQMRWPVPEFVVEQLQRQQQQQQQPQVVPPAKDEFPVAPPQAQQIVVEPQMPPQEVMGEIYGRKFGRMLQDLIASRYQNVFMQQQMNNGNNPLMPQQQQRSSFPIENQQQQQRQEQEWWAQQQQQQPWAGRNNQFPPPPPPPVASEQQQQPQPPQGQPPRDQQQQGQGEGHPPALQPPQAMLQHAAQQFQQQQGEQQQQQPQQQFPQPPQQFPIFIAPEDQIQIEPPMGGAWQQPREHGPVDFMNNEQAPPAWTHQAESSQAPTSSSSMVDGEVKKNNDEEEKKDEGSNRKLIILHKAVDAEKTHEEENMNGPSQLADLPLKELQGQLAAAAAALAQQHELERQIDQQHDQQQPQARTEEEVEEEPKLKQEQQQPEMPEPKSVETEEQTQPLPRRMIDPDMPLIMPNEQQHQTEQPQQQQQPVEPAHQEEQQPEQVDFPAVKFPTADAPHVPEAQKPSVEEEPSVQNDAEEQHHNPIFFQVDEPQQNHAAGFAGMI